ncbi:hypothetical protein JKP88DRAFT_205038 [Tribonema minus]|uniref:CDP-diacylglycerol--glycerol-3-phosphate 3-phosphatidyltransferase n=1 Tax=Tribonema minus TaxID=303371 RepID=A0A835ZI94_9STRA|nr:hypothetical protein JKP88DRAFT_205038 [Tribonema minus]
MAQDRSVRRHYSARVEPIEIDGEQVQPLSTPQQFYETLMQGIAAARHRICMAALYLGTEQLERRMIQALLSAMQHRPDLRVDILLDHSRGLRGGATGGSLGALLPLLHAFGDAPRLRILLYQMPQLRGRWTWLPSPLNETVAVTHVKAFAFDDAVVVTGANLSRDYFTARQDRYVRVRGCARLADAYCALVDALAPWCFRATAAGAALALPLSADAAAEAAHFREKLAGAFRRGDTLIVPTLQHAALGVRGDEHATLALLSSAAAAAACAPHDQRNPLAPPTAAAATVDLATAYLNPPAALLSQLAALGAGARALSAAPVSHGFAGAAGVKGAIPALYAGLQARVGAAGVPLWEYAREGWTFHAKGVWGWPGGSGGGGGGAPCCTLVGSSNYNVRSAERDLESQLALFTANAGLQARLREEWGALLKYAAPAPAPDRPPHGSADGGERGAAHASGAMRLLLRRATPLLPYITRYL